MIPPQGNADFAAAMEKVLDVYRRPCDSAFPVVCMDETPRQLIRETRVERPVAQSLGHLLERLGHAALAAPMLESLQGRGPFPWTELDRQEACNPDFTPEPQERDRRWRVIVRRAPQPED